MNYQLKSGAILNYVAVILNTLLALIFTPIIIKNIGQGEYGVYGIVVSVIGYFSVLDFGLGNALVRYISKSKALNANEEEKNINSLFFFFYLIIGMVTALAGVIIYFKFENIFIKSLSIDQILIAKKMLIILLINTILTFPMSIFGSYLIASERFIFPKLINIFRIMLYPLIMYPLLKLGYKSVTMVLVLSGLNIVSLVFNMYYCIIKLKMKMILNFKKINFFMSKEIFTYSFFVFLNLLVDSIFNNTDQVILGAVCGATYVAIYNIANQIKIVYCDISTAISGVFLPKITKLIARGNNEKEVSNIFIQVSRLQIYLLLLILSGFYIFGETFIRLWVGPEYKDAYYIVLWLIGFGIIPLSQNIGICVLQAMNKHRFRSIIYTIIAILNILISIPLARKYQGIGAAVGSAIATILGQIIVMDIYYYKIAKIDIMKYWIIFLKITIPIAILSIIIKVINVRIFFNWINLIIAIIIYTIIYILYLWFITSNNYEKQLVTDLLKRITIKKRREK